MAGQHRRQGISARLGRIAGRAALAFCAMLASAVPAQAQFRSLENPSFEQNDPMGPGAPNFEIMPSANVPGWETTTNEIELWDSGFFGVPAYAGNVFAEMNASVNGTFYQNICLVNGEPITWTFAHRAREGGPFTQTAIFQVANSSGINLQSLAVQQSNTNNLVWTVNSGTQTYTGPSGFQRVQFTTTDPGSYGNFLDAIQLTLRPFIQLSAGSATGSEAVPSASVLTLRVTGTATAPITVNVTITGGTATRGTDYTTPNGNATFAVTVPAGSYYNTSIPLGVSIINDSAIEANETIAFSLSGGTGYTIGHTTTCGSAAQTTGTYTIVDNDSRVTLRNTWINAAAADQATISISRGATVADSLVSVANTANETDTDPTPTPVVFGETMTLAAAFPTTNGSRYSTTVSCTGAADTNLADGLTIATGETAIVCTYSNTRIHPLQVTKTSAMVTDGISASNPLALPGGRMRYCILMTNPAVFTMTGVVLTDPLPSTVTYVPGSARSGTSCATATTVEDDDAAGVDESDPFGVSRSGATIVGSVASLASGASFAIGFDVLLN